MRAKLRHQIMSTMPMQLSYAHGCCFRHMSPPAFEAVHGCFCHHMSATPAFRLFEQNHFGSSFFPSAGPPRPSSLLHLEKKKQTRERRLPWNDGCVGRVSSLAEATGGPRSHRQRPGEYDIYRNHFFLVTLPAPLPGR